jgi:hypothetical protein
MFRNPCLALASCSSLIFAALDTIEKEKFSIWQRIAICCMLPITLPCAAICILKDNKNGRE